LFRTSTLESSAEYERAQAGAAKSFKLLADLETNEEAKKLSLGRSNERWALLRKNFPDSRYLTDAPK
jgi:hypothetical protein